jgi:hypothetical protein
LRSFVFTTETVVAELGAGRAAYPTLPCREDTNVEKFVVSAPVVVAIDIELKEFPAAMTPKLMETKMSGGNGTMDFKKNQQVWKSRRLVVRRGTATSQRTMLPHRHRLDRVVIRPLRPTVQRKGISKRLARRQCPLQHRAFQTLLPII